MTARPGVVLHFGMPKTGTSVLQNMMHRLTADGPVEGVHYPAYGRGGKVAHHALAEALKSATADNTARIAADLAADLAATPGPAPRLAFYSSEAFANLCGESPAPAFGDFLQAVGTTHSMNAVMVIREMTSFLESMYLQSARFGNMELDFPAYLMSRQSWWVSLLSGLSILSVRFGSAFEIRLAEPGYDVLAHFAQRLSLPFDQVKAVAAGVPSTTKLSWKAQIVLAYLDRFEARLGYPIPRAAVLRALGNGLTFDDDLNRYTILRPKVRLANRRRFARLARDGGLTGYATLFGDADLPDLPFVPIRPGVLTETDLGRLSVVRDLEKPVRRRLRLLTSDAGPARRRAPEGGMSG